MISLDSTCCYYCFWEAFKKAVADPGWMEKVVSFGNKEELKIRI